MRWIVGILIVLATAPTGGAQAPPARKSLPDWYPLKPGTKWTYELDPGSGRKIRVTNQVTRIETIDGESLARLETVINGRVAGTQHLLSTPQGVFRYRTGEADVSPPVCFLKYPFKEGETWDVEPKIGPQQLKISFKSGRKQEVISAAGKYKAISVTFESNVDGIHFETTSWYAPDVGLVKESRKIGEKTITMDLVSFEAAK